MHVELYLARRYLWNKREGFWNKVISFIPVASVAVGVAALIITLAIMSGFRSDIQERMLGVHPHLYVSTPTGKLNPTDPLLDEKLTGHRKVEDWSPFISGEVLIGHGNQTTGATVKGVDPYKEPRIANLKSRLQIGNWEDLEPFNAENNDKPKIFLGKELSLKIGARMGSTVWCITPGSIGIGAFSLPQAHQFIVAGYIETGLYDYDSVIAYTNISSAQKLFGLGNDVTGVGVRLKDQINIDETGFAIQSSLEGRYGVRSWLSLNRNLFSALKLEKIVMFIVQTLITIVAAFMIISNLMLKISSKTKEIGILRAMGATQRNIKKIFLLQGILMGFIGSVLGLILGISGAIFLAKTNIIQLPPDVYYISHIPIRLDLLDISTVAIFAVVIITLASFYPAYRASKLDPIEAIRYG